MVDAPGTFVTRCPKDFHQCTIPPAPASVCVPSQAAPPPARSHRRPPQKYSSPMIFWTIPSPPSQHQQPPPSHRSPSTAHPPNPGRAHSSRCASPPLDQRLRIPSPPSPAPAIHRCPSSATSGRQKLSAAPASRSQQRRHRIIIEHHGRNSRGGPGSITSRGTFLSGAVRDSAPRFIASPGAVPFWFRKTSRALRHKRLHRRLGWTESRPRFTKKFSMCVSTDEFWISFFPSKSAINSRVMSSEGRPQSAGRDHQIRPATNALRAPPAGFPRPHLCDRHLPRHGMPHVREPAAQPLLMRI